MTALSSAAVPLERKARTSRVLGGDCLRVRVKGMGFLPFVTSG